MKAYELICYCSDCSVLILHYDSIFWLRHGLQTSPCVWMCVQPCRALKSFVINYCTESRFVMMGLNVLKISVHGLSVLIVQCFIIR